MATSEDLMASDAIEEYEQKVSEDLNCALCRKIFRTPRRIPCSHSFCQDCLQSHIAYSSSVKDTVNEFCCPICKTVVRSEEEISLGNWVYAFPHNTLLLSMLMKLKVKVDLVCDVCQAQNVQYPAKEMCIVCEQALCENCLKTHRYMRMSKSHDILKLDELPSKRNIVLQHDSVFKCVDHVYLPLEFYCNTHEVPLCYKCACTHHKSCPDVVELINETSNVSDTLNNIKLQITKLEEQFKKKTYNNMLNLRKLETQKHELTEEIRSLKKLINDALDDLEIRVKVECEKIYNEERNKTMQLTLECQSQIMSIKNSNFILSCVSNIATQTQMGLLVRRMRRQLSLSKTQLDAKYMESDIIKLKLEINPQLTSIVSVPRGQIAKMKMRRNDENPIITTGFKSLRMCKVKAVDVKEVRSHGMNIPWYADIKYVSSGLVMLVDHENNMCRLLDSSFTPLSFYIFSESPWQVCAAGQNIIAVSMHRNQTIQLLSIKDNTLTPLKKIRTRLHCHGIATASQEEMIVSGPCGDGKMYYWSIIAMDGKEKFYHEFCGIGHGQTYIALNALKKCFYISVFDDNSLHCFGLDGKKYFTFKHEHLKGPQNVAIHNDDNVYVVGFRSRSILQLSPDGVHLQTITNVVPKNPTTMCFNEDGDRFLLTCYISKELHVFKLDMVSN